MVVCGIAGTQKDIDTPPNWKGDGYRVGHVWKFTSLWFGYVLHQRFSGRKF